MGMLRAIGGAVGGTLADQWKDVITAGRFDEHSAVVPGVLKDEDNGRGSNGRGSEGVITNGSSIYVPENTAAFIFNQSGIENIISQPGGYEYHDGQDSVFQWRRSKEIDLQTDRRAHRLRRYHVRLQADCLCKSA